MRRLRIAAILIVTASTGLGLCACAPHGTQREGSMPDASKVAAPPLAEARPQPVLSPNGVRIDPYYWLRDDTRLDPRVLGHLHAENEYTDAALEPLKGLEEKLYQEIVTRIPQDDVSVPYRKRGYWYVTRLKAGSEYPIYARRRDVADAPEELLLDVNVLASGHDYFNVGTYVPSYDNRLMAYAEDSVGRRQYVLRVKDLQSGAVLPDTIENAEPSIVWAGDNESFLYVEKDPVTLLGFRVRRHFLGANVADDPIVWEQADTTFYTDISESKSGRYIFIGTESTVSSEWWYARTDDPTLKFKVVLPRERDHEYSIEDQGADFIIRTNWQAPNFRMMRAPIDSAGDRSTWRDIVPHRGDTFLHDFEVFRDFLAVAERSGGLRKIRVKPWSGGAERLIDADEAAYTAMLGANPELDSNLLRYTYTSLTTPTTTYDYDMQSGSRTLLKRDPVPAPFDSENYRTEYLHAPARDGQQVPVSIVYRKGLKRDGRAPIYQYGYGSYGISLDPAFSPSWVSLLDRGFVVAIAHIRGGQELGRRWYDDGRLLHKINTFTDFIDVTDYLVRERWGARDKVIAEGRSAGGLLMGAIANMAPERYRVILAGVPFVDVVTTMLDESIPLTTGEYDEWGDPREPEYYDYMLSYSPYDQVAAHAYPAMLVTTGLWDSQVQYFEPAKWVAKLRVTKTDTHPLLLHTNMEAGHGGRSGRFRRYRETAMEYAFVLGQLGINR
jgi:oligopeptidase B